MLIMTNTKLSKLLSLATSAMEKAYCPYTNFAVGSALVTNQNTIHAGCNVENSVLGLTQCAEQNAVGTMLASEGKTMIAGILVIANGQDECFPCGSCCQLLYEFADGTLPVYLVRDNEIITYHLHQLLPYYFNAVSPRGRIE